MSGPRAVTVLLQEQLITLTRALGLIRRRGFPVHALAVGPTDAPGISRLTIMMQSDEATAERAVQHLQKIIGVRAATAVPPEGLVARELALVKLRSAAERYAELLDVVQLYHGTVVDESDDVLIVELSGPEAFVLSGIRALERFDIIEVARSGTVALESGAAELRTDTQPQLEAGAT
jgi:acetolactate synthase-1/3 small subunit